MFCVMTRKLRTQIRQTSNAVWDLINYNQRLTLNGVNAARCISFSLQRHSEENKSDETHSTIDDRPDAPYPEAFINRNPRSLEYLGYARKRKGWDFQSPRRDYYHKVIFDRSTRHITGRVEHFTGATVVSASTKEWAIRQHLYSCVDVSAAENVGRVLAERCLECGITHMFHDESLYHPSEKLDVFIKALQDGQLCLQEPEEIEPEYVPGIDYDRPNRYAEQKKWKDDIQV